MMLLLREGGRNGHVRYVSVTLHVVPRRWSSLIETYMVHQILKCCADCAWAGTVYHKNPFEEAVSTSAVVDQPFVHDPRRGVV